MFVCNKSKNELKLKNSLKLEVGKVLFINNLINLIILFDKNIINPMDSSPNYLLFGYVKTYLRMAMEWYWVGIRKDVAVFIQNCQVCQQQKYSQQSPVGLLQPLPIPSLVWEDISIDFIEGLPVSKGVDKILVVVDRLSKYAHFISLRHPFTTMTFVEIFTGEVVRLHGFPAFIVSDRDRIFMSYFWRELFKV